MSANNSFCKIALPYAKALFESSQAMRLIDKTSKDLKLIIETVDQSSYLRNFLENPLFTTEMKKYVLRKLFFNQVNQHVLHFLYILASRRRITLLHSVASYYFDLVHEFQLVILAEVSTAIPLAELQRQALQDKLKHMTNSKQIQIIERINPEVIGGLIIKVGSKVIDMSICGQLSQISSYLNSDRI